MIIIYIIYLALHSMYICVDTYNINLKSENERNILSKWKSGFHTNVKHSV